MNIAVIGAGYVGLVTAAGLASLGHHVSLGEANADRVRRLEDGEIPIYESGLDELVRWSRSSNRLRFHQSNIEAVKGAELVFLCLPTPAGDDGRADLSFVESVVRELAHSLESGAAFVVKSTVPPDRASAPSEPAGGGKPNSGDLSSRVPAGRHRGP